MKVIHGSNPEENESTEFKTCPICGSVCFADMEICFGCLHHFSDDESDAAKNENEAKNALRSPAEISASLTESIPTLVQGTAALKRQPFESDEQPSCNTESNNHDINDRINSTHICKNKEGQQFEITISVKML